MSDEATEAWISRMQRRLNLSDEQVTRMDFSDEEGAVVEVDVHRGDPGIQAEQQIANLLQSFEDDIQNFWSNYANGLASFETTMSFSSESAARPQHLKVVFKALAKRALDKALSELSTRMGPWGEIVGAIKDVAEAWVKESERARAAGGEVKIRDYIVSIRNGISGQRDAMIRAVEAQRRPLIQEFQRLAAGDVGGGRTDSDGVIVGEAAGLMNRLQSDVRKFRAAIPSNSAFQQLFSRNFADTPGWTGGITQPGTRVAGVLHLSMRLELVRGEPHQWSVDSVDSAWELATNAPQADRIVDSLVNSLGSKKVWEIDLPKMVKLRIDVEDYEFNYMPQGYIRFDGDPGRFEVRTNGSPEWLRAAWQVREIRDRALRVNRLEKG